ncbi:MAG TPA: AbrB/MazE/SpoVT family DNA-binding domain-containing protein [Terracidiphilus sp.]|nr:AbrB/MazE/SpoVT family DNA-binding domain-containing protein [Terracidiphilus sp.]
MYKAKVTSKGQITIPAPMREELGMRPGEKLVFVRGGDGEFLVRREGSLLDLAGCVPYSGPPISVEEMKQAVADHATARDEATMNSTDKPRARRSRKQAA